MDIFSIDVTENEISFLRQALDLVQISGRDAKFLASLQMKLEQEISEIQELKKKAQEQKQKELEDLIKFEETKQSSKK